MSFCFSIAICMTTNEEIFYEEWEVTPGGEEWIDNYIDYGTLDGVSPDFTYSYPFSSVATNATDEQKGIRWSKRDGMIRKKGITREVRTKLRAHVLNRMEKKQKKVQLQSSLTYFVTCYLV